VTLREINPQQKCTQKSKLVMQIIYKAIFGLLMIISFLTASGQITIPEPEYTGNIIYIDNGQAKPLEKQKASGKAKAGVSLYIVGVGKVKGTNNVTGVRSPIRTIQRDSLSFIVRVTDNSVDPFQLINIFKLEQNSNKNIRFIEVSNTGTFSGASVGDIAFIPFEAKKYGEKSYLIRIQKQLVPGEYAITIEGSRDLFNMFGVD
jgi:hypothetical protein